MSYEQIVERMTEDAHSRFKTIYDLHYMRSCRFVKSYVLDEEASKDIVASSFTSLWQQMQEKEIDNEPTLLLTILRNNALNYLRHEAVKRKALNDISELQQYELSLRTASLEECDPNDIFVQDVQRIIDETLLSLPPLTRRIFEMSRYKHLSNAEIAEETSLTVKSVEYHITKALKALRISLKDYMPIFLFFFS